jgi:HSP20 family protein
MDIRFSSQTIEEKTMNHDPKKWNPFKFLRGSGSKSDTDSPESQRSGEPWRAAWPDIQRLFSRESLRALEDFFPDPLATSVHRVSSRALTWSTKGRYCA